MTDITMSSHKAILTKEGLSTPAGISMLYIDLFKSLERARWNMETDIPWANFAPDLLTDEQAMTIKMNAITEWAALPATERCR